MNMREVLEFLRATAKEEVRLQKALFTEPDDKKFVAMVRAYDARFSGDLRSGMSRPTRMPASYYKDPEQLNEAKKFHERSVFAVVRYEYGDGELYRAFMGELFRGDNGEDIDDNYYVTEDAGAPKITTRYTKCFNCNGAELIGGKHCPECKGLGWKFDGGAKLKKLGRVLEIKKLGPPSDRDTKVAYDLIDEPD
jgi:hypothetical protein